MLPTWRGGAAFCLTRPIPRFPPPRSFFRSLDALCGQTPSGARDPFPAFGRFVSPAVVARLVETLGALEFGGLQRELTLLFCDIRSFRTISEGWNASELTHFLNEYLTQMTDAILDETGTLDKYWARHRRILERPARRVPRSCGEERRSKSGVGDAIGAGHAQRRLAAPRRERSALVQAGELRNWHRFGRVLRRQSGLAAPIRPILRSAMK